MNVVYLFLQFVVAYIPCLNFDQRWTKEPTYFRVTVALKDWSSGGVIQLAMLNDAFNTEPVEGEPEMRIEKELREVKERERDN